VVREFGPESAQHLSGATFALFTGFTGTPTQAQLRGCLALHYRIFGTGSSPDFFMGIFRDWGGGEQNRISAPIHAKILPREAQ
jgi:hypothetical protein